MAFLPPTIVFTNPLFVPRICFNCRSPTYALTCRTCGAYNGSIYETRTVIPPPQTRVILVSQTGFVSQPGNEHFQAVAKTGKIFQTNIYSAGYPHPMNSYVECDRCKKMPLSIFVHLSGTDLCIECKNALTSL